jgi:hypothetical protein
VNDSDDGLMPVGQCVQAFGPEFRAYAEICLMEELRGLARSGRGNKAHIRGESGAFCLLIAERDRAAE